MVRRLLLAALVLAVPVAGRAALPAPPGSYVLPGTADQSGPSWSTASYILGAYLYFGYDASTGAGLVDSDGTDACTDHDHTWVPGTLTYTPPPRIAWSETAWWQAQLDDALAAGLDFVLPVWSGRPGIVDGNVEGLRTLAAVLLARDAAGTRSPRIGLFWDDRALQGLDLSSTDGRDQFYGAIRDFYSLVPPRHRLRTNEATVAWIESSRPPSVVDPAAFTDARERFRADFGGELWFIGDAGWTASGVVLDQDYAWGAALAEGARLEDVCAIGPGYDDRAAPYGDAARTNPRRNGAFLRESLDATFPHTCRTLVFETWNRFAEGSDIAHSYEHGRQYITLAAELARRFRFKVSFTQAIYHYFLAEDPGAEALVTTPALLGDYGPAWVRDSILDLPAHNALVGDTAYVEFLYRRYLGRLPSDEERQTAIQFLWDGGRRAQLRDQRIDSEEARGLVANVDFVTEAYRQILLREPSAAELSAGLGGLAGGGTRAALRDALLVSPELRSLDPGALPIATLVGMLDFAGFPRGTNDCTAHWIDDDGDGMGAGLPRCLFDTEGRYVAPRGDDCDDMRSSVHPGAPEGCNGRDDDCDGQVDEGGAGSLCDDLNPCTDDTCSADGECVRTPNTAPCDDGSACTEPDVCRGAVCIAGPIVSCDDGDPCTEDRCDRQTGCSSLPGLLPCDDGDVCTLGDTCVDGACEPGAPSDCDDRNPCTDDTCDPMLGCDHVRHSRGCEDGNPCTVDDTCRNGQCFGGPWNGCDDGDPCTADFCYPPAGCSHTANEAPCEDGDACTAPDVCGDGQCHAGPTLACDDDDPCTDDACDPAFGCRHTPTEAPCSDGSDCTVGDRCRDGACLGDPRDCDDEDPCTDDSCDPARGCLWTYNQAPCDDANLCTTGDACFQGACFPGGPTSCDDGDPCTEDGCAPASGCTHTPRDAPCDDGDLCTVGDTCREGTCTPGAPRECSDANPCSLDSCVPTVGCWYEMDPCDDDNPCTDDRCELPGGCQHAAHTGPCEDGDACTRGDACEGTRCVPGPRRTCDDGEECTLDACDPTLGCVVSSLPDGSPCTPSAPCESATCRRGVCESTVIPGCCASHEDCTTPFELCDAARCTPVLCRECASDADCGTEGNECVALPGGAGCGVAPVAGGAPCPAGGVPTEIAPGVSQCLPEVGDCRCRPHDAQACRDGALVWLSSCDEVEDVADDCGGRGCVDGACCPPGTYADGETCATVVEPGADVAGPPTDVVAPIETVTPTEDVVADVAAAEDAHTLADTPAVDVAAPLEDIGPVDVRREELAVDLLVPPDGDAAPPADVPPADLPVVRIDVHAGEDTVVGDGGGGSGCATGTPGGGGLLLLLAAGLLVRYAARRSLVRLRSDCPKKLGRHFGRVVLVCRTRAGVRPKPSGIRPLSR